MGRPAKFTTEAMLDAALALFVEGGPESIRITGVAARLGAPSGSIYHRFDSRIALAAALWNRTVARFQAPILTSLDTHPRPDAVATVRAAIDWCEAHPDEAALLVAGPSAAGPESWPVEAIELREAQQQALAAGLTDLSSRLGRPVERVQFALVDLVIAAVRRQAVQPDAAWTKLAVEAAARVLRVVPFTIEALEPGSEDRLRRVRLMSLLDAPEAFGSRFDEVVTRPPESWVQQLRDLKTFVAVVDGRDVGIVRGMAEPDRPGVTALISMWVAAQGRGLGIGEALVEAVVTWAEGLGGTAVVLEVAPANTPALQLYERCGFRLLQTRTADGELQMERTLSDR